MKKQVKLLGVVPRDKIVDKLVNFKDPEIIKKRYGITDFEMDDMIEQAISKRANSNSTDIKDRVLQDSKIRIEMLLLKLGKDPKVIAKALNLEEAEFKRNMHAGLEFNLIKPEEINGINPLNKRKNRFKTNGIIKERKILNIIFMGTPDFAKESLEAIYNAGHNIVGVVTNPDKPKGRGMKLLPSEVKKFALEKNLKIYQPIKIKNNEEFITEIKNLNPDVICVVAYGKILPQEILEIPKFGCINVHASLLPKYRGAAPIQWAILNGDKLTGVTTMYMNEGMDTGDIILQEEVEIGEDETTGELWERLSKIGGKLLVKTLKQIETNSVVRQKQGEDFTIAPMLSKEMAKIDWKSKTAQEIKNLVRGLNPIMGAYAYLNNKKIKFWKVDLAKEDEIIVENLNFLTNGTVLISNPKDRYIYKNKRRNFKGFRNSRRKC